MLALDSSWMTLAADSVSFKKSRGAVAKVLLEYTSGGQGGLAQRDIAAKTGVDWYTVHMSLKSIRDVGAIKIERNRIIVNKESLKRLAEESGATPA